MSHPKSEAVQAEGDARATLREALSAAVDGEAAELELRRVVNGLGENAALRAEWESAHLIGAVMRGGRNPHALAPGDRPWLQDAAPSATRTRWARRAWPALGAAAAVVAALAVVLSLGSSGTPDAPAPAVASAPANVAGAEQFRRLASTPSRVDVRRTNLYMSRHLHQTSLSRGVAVPLPAGTPYVKIMAVQDGQAAPTEGRAASPPAR